MQWKGAESVRVRRLEMGRVRPSGWVQPLYGRKGQPRPDNARRRGGEEEGDSSHQTGQIYKNRLESGFRGRTNIAANRTSHTETYTSPAHNDTADSLSEQDKAYDYLRPN